MVFTVGQDMTLVATSLSSARLVFSLPCFAGVVAIGAGEEMVRSGSGAWGAGRCSA